MRMFLNKSRFSSEQLSELKSNVYNSPKECLNCGAGRYGIYINSAFNLMLCPQIYGKRKYVINLNETDMLEAYSDLQHYIALYKGQEIKNCTGCYAQSICKMCFARANEGYDEKEKISYYYVDEQYCEGIKEEYNFLLDAQS